MIIQFANRASTYKRQVEQKSINVMIRVIIFISGLIIMGCNGSTTSETIGSDTINIIEELKLKTIDGETLALDQYKGKTIFINFWATWCRPCITEMPSIEKAQQKLKGENLVVLMVSNEPRGQIKSFIDTHNYHFKYAQLDMPLEQLNIQGLPTTFIINPQGQLVFSEMGARDWSNEENIMLIREYLK